MKQISAFDVIGPNMIGPSSSHTAGAVRIARVVRSMVDGPIASVVFHLYGSFAMTYQGHGTDRALLAGLLGMDTDDLRIRDSFYLAKKEGIEFSFVPDPDKKVEHPNTVDIDVTLKSGRRLMVTGVSTGGGSMRIDAINGVNVRFTGEFYTLVIEQDDQPGVIKHVSTCLSDHKINIAFMKVYREARGKKAYAIVEADQPIDPCVLTELSKSPLIFSVSLIEL